MIDLPSAFAKFSNPLAIRGSMNALLRGGISQEQIGVMQPDYDTESDSGTSIPNKVYSLALSGALIGAVVFSILVFMIFATPVAFTEASYGWLIVLVAVLAAAVLGANFGALISLRLSKNWTRLHLNPEDGHEYILTIKARDLKDLERARRILVRQGGLDVSTTNNQANWKETFTKWEKVKDWEEPSQNN